MRLVVVVFWVEVRRIVEACLVNYLAEIIGMLIMQVAEFVDSRNCFRWGCGS
jgi:hypothetical protein